jgi:hypothetical protein
MSHKHKEREEVFAVLRYDAFHKPETPPEIRVTVKEVVRSRELAEAEVGRLNAVNNDNDCRYWWQQTQLFPEGRSAGAS